MRSIIGSVNNLGQDVISNLPERQTNQIKKRRRKITGQGFKLDTQIDGFEVKNIMLDLGSNVNVLPKKSLEALGHPKLVYSSIQLHMAN